MFDEAIKLNPTDAKEYYNKGRLNNNIFRNRVYVIKELRRSNHCVWLSS